MESKEYDFNNEHLQNIKNVFERKSGVQLSKKKVGFAYRKLVVTALVVLCLSIGTPVLAANVPAVYELMYSVSPSIAQFFKPVQKSDKNNGIKMEVMSAYIHGDTAHIYISLQDLTGDRVDNTTDLNDSYSINKPFSSSATCERVGYDEKTKTATFLITIQQWGNHSIQGDKITFSIREFLSHKKYHKDVAVPINLSGIGLSDNAQQVHANGGSGLNFSSLREKTITALIPTTPMNEFNITGINLTGIGYIDKQLHIQMAVSDYLNNDNHGFFYLKDKDGNTINCSYSFNFSSNYNKSDRTDYCEDVFDIAKDKVGQYSLMGDFVTSGMRTEEYLSVTFPLEQAEK